MRVAQQRIVLKINAFGPNIQKCFVFQNSWPQVHKDIRR
jgi:hypothetical protein